MQEENYGPRFQALEVNVMIIDGIQRPIVTVKISFGFKLA